MPYVRGICPHGKVLVVVAIPEDGRPLEDYSDEVQNQVRGFSTKSGNVLVGEVSADEPKIQKCAHCARPPKKAKKKKKDEKK